MDNNISDSQKHANALIASSFIEVFTGKKVNINFSSGQLTENQSKQLYPKKSTKIWDFVHCLNEEDCIERRLLSTQKIAYKQVVLIDDRTTDRTEEIARRMGAIIFKFKWHHDFSHAKNLCLEFAMTIGLEYGDWVLFMGADFVLNTLDMEFVKNPLNFFGQFEVPEFHKEGEQFVTRRRKLLWRHHQMIYWEKLVHEEAVYSAYRLTGLGVVFGTAKYKEYPVVGEMTHYGFHEDGGEQGEIFWKKKCYYLILTQIQRVMGRFNFPQTEKGMLDALKHILNNDNIYEIGIDKAVTDLHQRYLSGDIPQGLAEIARNWKAELEGKGEYL